MIRSEALLVNAAIWVDSVPLYRQIAAMKKITVSLRAGTMLMTGVVIGAAIGQTESTMPIYDGSY